MPKLARQLVPGFEVVIKIIIELTVTALLLLARPQGHSLRPDDVDFIQPQVGPNIIIIPLQAQFIAARKDPIRSTPDPSLSNPAVAVFRGDQAPLFYSNVDLLQSDWSS